MMMNGFEAPCKNCTERYPACHDHCQKYIEVMAKVRERAQKIAEAREIARLNYTSRGTGVSLRRKMKGENR